jgi:hypothetical protein
VFSSIVKANEKLLKNISSFNCTLWNTTSNWCHNYMLEFLNCTFFEITHAFANIIKRLRMMNKYTWSWRTWNKRRLKGWRFIMNKFKSWFMVYKY